MSDDYNKSYVMMTLLSRRWDDKKDLLCDGKRISPFC